MLIVLILVSLTLAGCSAESQCTKYEEDGGALLLTPYIEQGRVEDGRKAARVSNLLGSIESYSGFFTVDKEHHSNLFFWYFPAEEAPKDGTLAPVMLWLNGGPGQSSMYGLLIENGPIAMKEDYTLTKRRIYWSKRCHMIYIDNPVGVGFSFTGENGLLNNQTQISKAIHNALVQFFQLFPHLSKNNFFIAGESYGGRYVPPIAYEIHRKNPTSKVNINLKGVLVGNGVVDNEVLHRRGELFAQLGVIDLRQLPVILEKEEAFVDALKSRNYTAANRYQDEVYALQGNISVSRYNFLKPKTFYFDEFERLGKLFNGTGVRKHLHVGNTPFLVFNSVAGDKIVVGDGFIEMSPYVQVLLEHYRVLYYNGLLDLELPYINCEKYAEGLQWSGSSKYRNAPRNEWRVGDDVAGFSRTGGNLTLVLVLNSGHMVPLDQPEWAFDLVMKFVNDQHIV